MDAESNRKTENETETRGKPAAGLEPKFGDKVNYRIVQDAWPPERSDSYGRCNSTASGVQERKMMMEVLDRARSSKMQACQVLKLLSVIVVPLLALVLISAMNLSSAVHDYERTEHSIFEINNFLQIDSLVTSLQIERGTSATYLTSNSTDAIARLRKIWNRTEQLSAKVREWPAGFRFNNTDVISNERFQSVLTDLRLNVKERLLNFTTSTHMYTDINAQLMTKATTNVNTPGKGDIWKMMVSASSSMRAADDMGIQRAFGAAYFSLCKFDLDVFLSFAKLEGQVAAHRSTCFQYRPHVESNWNELYIGSPLKANIESMLSDILSPSYAAICLGQSAGTRYYHSKIWFEYMTGYINLWKRVRDEISESIRAELISLQSEYENDVLMFSILMVTAIILSLVIGVLYVINMNKLLSRIASFANKVMETTVRRLQFDDLKLGEESLEISRQCREFVPLII